MCLVRDFTDPRVLLPGVFPGTAKLLGGKL